MKFAEEGHLPKNILVNLLRFDQRRPYIKGIIPPATPLSQAP
jgi:hypothetical protein